LTNVVVVSLLAEVSYNVDHDHVIFAGDRINKGPSSRIVVKLIIAMGGHPMCMEITKIACYSIINTSNLMVYSGEISARKSIGLSTWVQKIWIKIR
jgi:hypothetical protein